MNEKKQRKYGQVHGVYISIYGNNIRSLRSRGYPFTKQPTLANTKQKNQQTNKQKKSTEKCIIVMRLNNE